MSYRIPVCGFLLVVGLVILSACGPAQAHSPTVVPTPALPTDGTDVPDAVLASRDAFLRYLAQRYGKDAPAVDLPWRAERTSGDLPGWGEYRFTAGAWVVTVGYAILPPESTVYQVTVVNQAGGLSWKGEVDATGQAVEQVAPDGARAARDAVLSYLSSQYRLDVGPARGRTWLEERITPQGLLGAETFLFSAGNWMVTISFPIVAPEATSYQVKVTHQASSFSWEGTVDAGGQVSE